MWFENKNYPLKYRIRFMFFEIHSNPKCKDVNFKCNCSVGYRRLTRTWFQPIEVISNKLINILYQLGMVYYKNDWKCRAVWFLRRLRGQ